MSIKFISESSLPTRWGTFRVRAYRDEKSGTEPIAIISGSPSGRRDVLARVHDQCITSEVFGSLRCDCREQLEMSLAKIQSTGEGCVIYLHQEGRGIGLANKISAYALQDEGYDTVDANRILGLPDDKRDYSVVKEILNDIGVTSIQLMTNNPRKISHLRKLDVEITCRIPSITKKNSHNKIYLETKESRMGHFLMSSPSTFSDVDDDIAEKHD